MTADDLVAYHRYHMNLLAKQCCDCTAWALAVLWLPMFVCPDAAEIAVSLHPETWYVEPPFFKSSPADVSIYVGRISGCDFKCFVVANAAVTVLQ